MATASPSDPAPSDPAPSDPAPSDPATSASSSALSTPPTPAAQPDTITLDSRAIRVLAQPMRSRLLTALRLDGPATSTGLAEALGTNSGATSYHLRKLADVGLVVDTGDGRGRERVWRASTAMHNWADVEYDDDPDTQAASAWLRGHYLRYFVARADAWLAVHEQWPAEWRAVAGSDDRLFDMSAARLGRMLHEVRDVLERYRVAGPGTTEAERPGDGATARLGTYLFAYPLVDGADGADAAGTHPLIEGIDA